jgi:hypothetical protein
MENLEIVAYRERTPSWSDTVLRTEWRVRPVEACPYDYLVAAWGKDWGYHHPETTHVLEQRYIRNGVEEPWRPSFAARSRAHALEHVDGGRGVVELDPELIAQTAATIAESERMAAEKNAQAAAAHDAEARRERVRRSEKAFGDLSMHVRDGHWAARWTTFVADADKDDEFFASIRADDEFRRLHNAVIAAITVPAKRKAIKAFLAYAEPMLAKHEKV